MVLRPISPTTFSAAILLTAILLMGSSISPAAAFTAAING